MSREVELWRFPSPRTLSVPGMYLRLTPAQRMALRFGSSTSGVGFQENGTTRPVMRALARRDLAELHDGPPRPTYRLTDRGAAVKALLCGECDAGQIIDYRLGWRRVADCEACGGTGLSLNADRKGPKG